MNRKHAYLIMAHAQPELLKMLLHALDDERNDIYLHLDKKSDIGKDDLKTAVARSGLFFAESMNVTWAGESLIICEMNLFKMANATGYEYYHLISGADFPLRSQDEIHGFFEENAGYEFMDFWKRDEKEYLYRIRYKYPLQEKIGRYTNDPRTLFYRVCSKLNVLYQKLTGVDRVRGYGREILCGSQWVSVTDAFVKYLLSNEEEIREFFFQGVAADELYKQTICRNSEFYEKVYPGGSMRLIDWERGDPYTWTENDIDEITRSDAMFIRKVTQKNDLPKVLAQTLNL